MSTLSEKTVIGMLELTVMPLVMPKINVAPLMVGCVVKTTRPLGRSFETTPLRPPQLAERLATLPPPPDKLHRRPQILLMIL